VNAENTVLQNVGSKMKWMGWLCIVFGILAIAMPWVAGQSILMMVGILVMAAGTVAIGVFLGIKLLFVGITMLTVRSAVKNAF